MILFSDIDISLKNFPIITKHYINKLEQLDIVTIGDILAHIPVDYEWRDELKTLHAITDTSAYALISITVLSHTYVQLRNRGRLLKIIFEDEEHTVGELHCYGRDFIKNLLPIRMKAILWAKFADTSKRKIRGNQFISSQFEIITDTQRMQGIIPHYKTPASFSQVAFFKLMKSCLQRASAFPSLHPYENYYPTHTMNRDMSIRSVHFPESKEAIIKARKNLAFDEALLFQLSLELSSLDKKHIRENKRHQSDMLVALFIKSLPFSLTRGQIQIVHEIEKDMLSDYPMRRLLQGDVGSGKTLVALICALIAIENKQQVVLVAPSETLAHQHYRRISDLLSTLNASLSSREAVRCCVLTGSMMTKDRSLVMQGISQNAVHFIIGTHALYSENVVYNNLGFIVFDEQHRFGIEQRQALLEKGNDADMLLMSATPIPRTLALTLYSHLDISTLNEKPGISTTPECRMIDFNNRHRMYAFIRSVLQKGEQAFFVFPQIGLEDDEQTKSAVEMSSVIAMQQEIQSQLHPFSVEVLHSKIDAKEQKEIMIRFEKKEIAALLCTTIIEVGIDVHNATLMCIFNAERFGLATLHQLRGRVGRGTLPGTVLLVYNAPLNDIAKERLKIIYESNDGFEIAEKDLELRGPGDIDQLGLRQSGSLFFQFLDTQGDTDILYRSQSLAKKIAEEDPTLEKQEHAQLKKMMQQYNKTV